MTCALIQVLTVQGVHMYYFPCYIKPVWPLLLKAFVINSLKCRKILLFSVVKSSINFSIFGLCQKYRLIYISLRSWYREHCNMKWNSSSKTSQLLHFLFSNGILFGFAHLPISTSSLWDDTLNRHKLFLYFSDDKISKYFWNWKFEIVI